MAGKTILVLCAQALLVQFISSQCIGAYDALAYDAPYAAYTGAYGAMPCAAGWAAAPYAEWGAYSPATLAASNGAGLAITSASAIPPTGVAVTSENAYEGALAVSGALPFLGAVAMEGPLPTLGAGAVTYGCGNGNVAILNEDYGTAGYGQYGVYGNAAAAELGYGAYGPYGAAESGYGYAAPYAYEAAVGPAYSYRGCGAIY